MLMLELERILRAEWLMQRAEDFATTHVAGRGTNPLRFTCDAVECQCRLMLYIVVYDNETCAVVMKASSH